MTVTIYGSSDDLIEVEGDIREEFNPPYDEPCWLALSDGTVLSVAYTDEGFWRIAPVHPGSATVEVTQGTDSDSDYSDRAVIGGVPIAWVALVTAWCRPPSAARMVAEHTGHDEHLGPND